MIRADVIFLVTETPGSHGWFDAPTYTERQVLCTVGSVGRTEYYQAHAQGLAPEVVFNLTDAVDYDGERMVRWGEKYYRVIRTYVTGLGIEITCEPIAPITTEEATTDGAATT